MSRVRLEARKRSRLHAADGSVSVSFARKDSYRDPAAPLCGARSCVPALRHSPPQQPPQDRGGSAGEREHAEQDERRTHAAPPQIFETAASERRVASLYGRKSMYSRKRMSRTATIRPPICRPPVNARPIW